MFILTVYAATQVEGRPDIVIDLTKPGALESLKDKPYTIKEGSQFRMKATFKVQHQILSGLKYVQVVKRMGVSNKLQEMIVSLRVLQYWGTVSIKESQTDPLVVRVAIAQIQRISRCTKRNVSKIVYIIRVILRGQLLI